MEIENYALYLIITCLIILFTSQIIYCCFIRYLIYQTNDIQESSLQIHREIRKTIILQDRDIIELEDNLENHLEDLTAIIQRTQNSNRSLPPLPSISTSVQTIPVPVQTPTLTSVYCDTPDIDSPPLTLTELRRRTAETERAEEESESETESESESESESEDSEEQEDKEEDETVDLNTSRVERRREKKKRRLRSYMFKF